MTLSTAVVEIRDAATVTLPRSLSGAYFRLAGGLKKSSKSIGSTCPHKDLVGSALRWIAMEIGRACFSGESDPGDLPQQMQQPCRINRFDKMMVKPGCK